jgi:23S rRNA pseudouridine2605 synthase
VRDPEYPTMLSRDDIAVDGNTLVAQSPIYLMLNKPRGLVTTVSDERGRDTVYRCFDGASLCGAPLPWVAPVGRLDKASEGLLLFTNDPQWAARITDPQTGPHKTYRVQIDSVPEADLLSALCDGVDDAGERLAVVSASLLGAGEKNAWVEIVLEEGRNRQIRRLLAAFDINVLRLIRVAIGRLPLGDLKKGQWRALGAEDLRCIGI